MHQSTSTEQSATKIASNHHHHITETTAVEHGEGRAACGARRLAVVAHTEGGGGAMPDDIGIDMVRGVGHGLADRDNKGLGQGDTVDRGQVCNKA